MLKIINSDSFFTSDEPTVNIINFDESKGMLKQAADSQIQEYISHIKPEPDKVYLHILALGAGQAFGPNRNMDWFPEENLRASHKTFETSGYIYRNHQNKDPKKSIGKVVFSVYNDRMQRVELIASLDKIKGADIIERIDNGDWPATSMACRIASDTCSICGNVAKTRQEYCTHLRNELGKQYPDGRRTMALNIEPLKFIDQSIVVRPADVTSSVLQKIASNSDHIIGSAEIAEMEDLSDSVITKQSSLKKLSELVKEINDGVVMDHVDGVDPILAKVQDPDSKAISVLRNFPLPQVFSTMANLGISPSIAFLSELIAIKTMGDHMKGSGTLIESLVSEMGIGNIEVPKEEEFVEHSPIYAVTNCLTPYMHGSSLLPEYVEKRASTYIGPGTNVGYIGNGPTLEATAYEQFRNNNLKNNDHPGFMKILHSLLGIGAAAIAAKWYITREIEHKMQEAQHNQQQGVKIILVKSASDLKITYRLAKAAMVKVLKKH